MYAPAWYAPAAEYVHTFAKYIMAGINYNVVQYLVEKSNLSYFSFLLFASFAYDCCTRDMRPIGLLFQDIVEDFYVVV